jgi:hypothetical protein
MTKRFAYIFLLTGLLLCSCTKKFTSLNQDPNKFTSVSPESVIEYSVRTLNNQIMTTNYGKYWDIGNQIWEGSRYDVTDAGLWKTAYNNVLEDLQQVINTYGGDSLYNNRVQIARILKWYTYSILAGQFGPVPCTQANNLNYLNTVTFDSEDSVYTYVLDSLKDAASRINLATTGDKLSYDIIYNGNNTYWVHFANSLRLKVAIRCMKNLNVKAVANIQNVMQNESNTISSEAETAKMNYENVTSNYNPYYQQFVFSTSYYPYTATSHSAPPRMAEFVQIFCRSYSDPRMDVYFDSVASLTARFQITDTLTSTQDDSLRVVKYGVPYLGKPLSANYATVLPNWGTTLTGLTNPMAGINDTTYSLVADNVINNPSRPIIMLSYAENLFLKAEAAYLGYGGGQSAEAYYLAGIAANFAYWGLSNAQLTAYENMNGVKWGTIGVGLWNYLHISNANIPDDIHKIWAQSWMNYFPDENFDSWCLFRRTHFFTPPPNLNPGGNSSYTSHSLYMDIPGRGSYPTTEATLNTLGYAQGLTFLSANPLNAGLVVANDYNPDILLNFGAPNLVPNWNNLAPNGFNLAYLQKWYGTTIQSLQAASASAHFPYTLVSTYVP